VIGPKERGRRVPPIWDGQDMRKKRVLIADDDPDTRFLLSLVLNDQGYELDTARDGVEALALAQQQPPDLMVVDHMMPRMTGTDCVAIMKRHPALREVPVVLVTAARAAVRAAGDVGFEAAVEKPLELEEFVRTVRRLCPPGAERRVRATPVPVDRRRLAIGPAPT
jgi:two-component system, sensor histidine kinase and response regulator